MTRADDPYSELKWKLADEYPEIWDNDHHLAWYVRLLVIADGTWPAAGSVPYGVPTRSWKALVECGLVILPDASGRRYRIKGLDKQRNARSNAGRNAAASRWGMQAHTDDGYGRIPEKMPHNRTEQNTSEQSTPAPAREGLPHITKEVQRAGEAITGHGILTAGDKQLTELDRLIEDHGAESVIGALNSVANGERKTWRQLVWDAVKHLEPFQSAPTSGDRKAQVRDEQEAADQARWAKERERTRLEIERLRSVGT